MLIQVFEMKPQTREQQLYLAQIIERAERFEDMLSIIKNMSMNNADLTHEERNYLSVACKNTIGPKRAALMTLRSILKQEKYSRNIELLQSYKAKIESELKQICSEVLQLIDSVLIPKSTNAEATIFFYKMKGDYSRYLSEHSVGEQSRKAGESSQIAYKIANTIVSNQLKTTNPIRLGFALSNSVFQYEIHKNFRKAYEIAKQAFEDAIAHIDQLKEQQYKDVTTILQLLRDNLTLWASELQQNTK